MKALHYILSATIACSLVACSDWDDHYEGSVAEGGDLTLWQQMKSKKELSDFCEVLEHTKLFRMHKKTKASYAEILNSGQSFTVMAPVNGTFNKDELIKLTETNQGDSIVEKFFVKNHIARSAYSITGEPKTIHMLNDKRIVLNPEEINEVKVLEMNGHAKNGVLNVVEKQLPYYYNLYEQMTDREEFKAVGDFIRSYDREEFDEGNSVQNGTIDGMPVYIDSVVIERNDFLTRYLGAKLTSEDSTYWMVVPTAAGWEKAYAEAEKCFVYPTNEEKRDSLQKLYAHSALFTDAIFTMTTNKHPEDSIRSLYWYASEPEYSVYKKPFAQGGLLFGAKATTSSNGMLYETEEWPFDPDMTYKRRMEYECESTSHIISSDKCSYQTRWSSGDSISNEGYLEINPSSNTANWMVKLRFYGVRSTKYDIGVIVLPQTVLNPNAEELKPYQFKADLGYLDENGIKKTYSCSWTDEKGKKQTKFNTNDPARVDTIWVAKGYEYPTCNVYDQQNDNFYLTLTCSMSAAENKKFTRPILIDCILLKPSKEAEEENEE